MNSSDVMTTNSNGKSTYYTANKIRNGGTAHNTSEDIYHYTRRVASCKRRLEKLEHGQLAIRFLDKLKLSGLSDGRVNVYGERLKILLNLFTELGIPSIQDATKQDCESVLSRIISQDTYSGSSKTTYSLCLLRLVHYAKTGEIGNRDTGYAPEVAWIRPSKYERNSSTRDRIQPEDLLTPKELYDIINKTTNKRDRAMLWVMFEGALRPGELLRLKVGGVLFKDNYVLISTIGKTGPKRVPLVTSLKPLLEWLALHPCADDPNAPLWYSLSNCSKTKQISYGYLQTNLKRCVQKANIKKRGLELFVQTHPANCFIKKAVGPNVGCLW